MLVLIYEKLGSRAVIEHPLTNEFKPWTSLGVGVYGQHLQKEKDVANRIYFEICSQPE